MDYENHHNDSSIEERISVLQNHLEMKRKIKS